MTEKVKGRRVSIDLTPPAVQEVDRLRQLTGLTTADVFRHALAVFRLYINAKVQGRELVIVDPNDAEFRSQIELPVMVGTHGADPITKTPG